jgi:hypothetical protein
MHETRCLALNRRMSDIIGGSNVKRENTSDNRWTVRFNDADDLARTRELVHIGVELEGMPIGRFLRLAIEQFLAERHGTSYVASMIKLERLTVQMDDLLMACDQRSYRRGILNRAITVNASRSDRTDFDISADHQN